MPEFSFICNNCGTTKTEYVESHADLKTPACLQCGDAMARDFSSDSIRVHAGGYRKAIHSDSLAIAPSQRKEHEQRFPYIKLDNKCRPVFDNFPDHEKYLNETGHVKNRAKQRRRMKKIS